VPDPGAPIRALGGAVGLLTRVPVAAVLEPRDLLRGAVLFSLVGAILGGILGGTAVALTPAVPPLAAAALAVCLELALTGCLHVDGLADSADGLGGGDRRRALEIMRDHSLGTYGATAMSLDLIVKAAALGALAESGDALPVAAALAVSRAAPLPLAAALPYARTGGGTGRLLADRLRPRAALAGVTLAGALAVALAGLAAAAAMTAAMLAVAGAIGLLAKRRLSGVTGDVMGAAVELTGTAALLVVLAV